MCPYVITERWDGAVHPKPHTTERPNPHAVATLDDAREDAERIVKARAVGLIGQWRRQAEYLPEQGGTVGPLPDGTVIQVEQVGWIDFERMVCDPLPLPDIETFDDDRYRAGLIDGFNAVQDTRAAANDDPRGEQDR